MSKDYKHLTKDEKFYIGKRLSVGDAQNEIARVLNRSSSSIGR